MTRTLARRWFVLLTAQPALARALRRVKGPGWYVSYEGSVPASACKIKAKWLPASECAVLAVVAKLGDYPHYALASALAHGRWSASVDAFQPPYRHCERIASIPLAAVLALAEELYRKEGER
jgi:hypothetical protein